MKKIREFNGKLFNGVISSGIIAEAIDKPVIIINPKTVLQYLAFVKMIKETSANQFRAGIEVWNTEN